MTRTSVTVTKPRSGSLTMASRFSAVTVLMRSAIFWARAVSATAPPWLVGTGASSLVTGVAAVDDAGRGSDPVRGAAGGQARAGPPHHR